MKHLLFDVILSAHSHRRATYLFMLRRWSNLVNGVLVGAK